MLASHGRVRQAVCMPTTPTTHPTIDAMRTLRESVADNVADLMADNMFSVEEVLEETALVAALDVVLSHSTALLAYL